MLSRLNKCHSAQECQQVIWAVFTPQFCPETAGGKEGAYEELARSLWLIRRTGTTA